MEEEKKDDLVQQPGRVVSALNEYKPYQDKKGELVIIARSMIAFLILDAVLVILIRIL